MCERRRLARFAPISIGILSQLVVMRLPAIILNRTGLPDWPWLIVMALSFAPVSTALILYGMRRLKQPDTMDDGER